MHKKVTLIIPCYNEQDNLLGLHDALKPIINDSLAYDWEILFINDGSKDDTLEVIKKLRTIDKRVCYIDLSRNFGKERAMLAGFDYATGDCAIILDADLQDPPSLIPEMLKLWEDGYQDVYARRKDRGKESWLRKKLSVLTSS